MLKIISSKNPEIAIAKETAAVLNSNLSKNKKVLWLLAGGSAVKYYALMSEYVEKDLDLSNLTISLGDERYDENPIHDTATWPVLRELELFQNFEKNGANIFHILTGSSLESDANGFDQFLKQEFDYILCSLGIGSDGHTAGIIPLSSEELFHQIYSNDKLAVGHVQGGKHPKRITITPKMITKSDKVLAYAVGEDKKPTLNTLQELDLSYPGENWKSNLHNYPALYITERNGEIFTDE